MSNILQKLKWLIEDLILWLKDKLDIRYNTPHKRIYDNGKYEETFTNSIFCDILYIWFITAFIFEMILFLCGIDSESIVESIPILFIIFIKPYKALVGNPSLFLITLPVYAVA